MYPHLKKIFLNCGFQRMALGKVSKCEHCLMAMLENSLDKSRHAAALLTDLGEKIDCVHHGNLYAYGFVASPWNFLYSYLVKYLKPRAKINSSCNLRTDLLLDVPKVLL